MAVRLASRARLAGTFAVFGFLLLRPLYVSYLRRAEAARAPQRWRTVSTDGSFAVLVPHLAGTRYFDESAYAARVRQVLVHGVPYTPYWREFRQVRHWLSGAIPAYFMAALGLVCGGDLNVAWVLAVALLGAGWFLLLWSAFARWCGRESVCAVLAVASTVFPDFYLWFLDLNLSFTVNWERYREIFFQTGSQVRPHWHRLPPVLLTYFLTALLGVGAWRLSQEKRPRLPAAAALGLGVGLLAFVHPFEHAFAGISMAVFAAGLWYFNEKVAAKNLTLALFFAGLVTGANLLWISPLGQEGLAELAAIERTRRFYEMSAVHLLVAAFALYERAKDQDAARRLGWLLFAAAQGGAFLCRNLQVVTGFESQPFHFITLGSFFGTWLLLLSVARRLAAVRWWGPRVTAAALSVLLVWGLANEKASAESTYRLFGLPREMEAGLRWLDANAPKDALLLSPSMLVNMAAPIYTSVKTGIQPINAPVLLSFTKEYYVDRAAALLKTCGVDIERFLATRWVTQQERRALDDRVSRAVRREHKVEAGLLEPLLWFYGWSYTDPSEERARAGRALLRQAFARAETLMPPYFVWLGPGDRSLLVRPPERSGGVLRFKQGSVEIYEYVLK